MKQDRSRRPFGAALAMLETKRCSTGRLADSQGSHGGQALSPAIAGGDTLPSHCVLAKHEKRLAWIDTQTV